MIMQVHLHNDYVDMLNSFGPIDEVVNNILSLGEAGAFPLERLPKAPPRKGCNIYSINITNDYYLNLIKMYGSTSSLISLRRILYYFIDHEIYNDHGWIGDNLVKKEVVDFNKRWVRCSQALTSLLKVVPNNKKLHIVKALQLLQEVADD